MIVSHPRVSVILCAYTEDRWDLLLDAVRSVERQTLTPSQILVVVDHNPGLFRRVRAELSGIQALENGRERGLSGARNSGVSRATGNIVAFLDDDAVAAPTWLEQLLAPYEDAHVLGVGGSIHPDWATGRPAWFPEEFDWVVGCSYRGMPEHEGRVRNLIGCNMSFRREVFDSGEEFRAGVGRVGTLPVGCEETELCIRVAERFPGGYFLFQPRAEVMHHVPADRATWRYFLSRCYSEGLSKALVTGFVGSEQGLSSERQYVLTTLPGAFLSGVRNGFLGRRPGELLRAIAVAAGLAWTSAGYSRGKVSRRSVVEDSVRERSHRTVRESRTA